MTVAFGTHVLNDGISSIFLFFVFFSFSFFQKSDFSGFSKFINKCQKEILRCAPPSSHVCDFLFTYSFFSKNLVTLLCTKNEK